jgi:hypothetical protein
MPIALLSLVETLIALVTFCCEEETFLYILLHTLLEEETFAWEETFSRSLCV